jgi:hypothetical protein
LAIAVIRLQQSVTSPAGSGGENALPILIRDLQQPVTAAVAGQQVDTFPTIVEYAIRFT